MTVTIPEKLGEYVLDVSDKTMIGEYGFIVTTRNSHFVVRDPKMPKRKQYYEGGNLYDLLMQAAHVRTEYEDKKQATKTQNVETESKAENAQDSTSAQPKPKRAEKDITTSKLFKIKKLAWENPDLRNNPKEIVKLLLAEGVQTTEGTVQITISDFFHSVKTLRLLGCKITDALCEGS